MRTSGVEVMTLKAPSRVRDFDMGAVSFVEEEAGTAVRGMIRSLFLWIQT
jgi:hypothetical protein